MRQLQREIIMDLWVQPEIDPLQEFNDRATFLSEYLGSTGLRGFVLGISGGQDSLLAGMIAQEAVNRFRQAGHEAEFHAVLLPYGTQKDRDDALLAVDTIKPDRTHDFDIKQPTDAVADAFEAAENKPLADYHKGNVKARMRMIAQYAIAGEYGLLVVGTDHAAEALTGFFTKFGDGGADVLPLSGLSKRQGRQILRAKGVPELFVTKKPTADLLDTNPGQADEYELGITYDLLDDYLEGKEVPEDIADRIEQRYETTRHKRSLPVAFTDK